MGIVNVTPDSFSDGGSFPGPQSAVEHGLALARAGAIVIDVGGESTRPGATPVPADVEAERVIPVVRGLAGKSKALLSVDTSKPEVAREAVAAGAHLINDVRGLTDAEMIRACVEAGVPAVAMHMQGEPGTMQQRPAYRDVVAEVHAFLAETALGARAAGLVDLIVDPGIGFGKTVEHNLALIAALEEMTPRFKVLVGASRKGLVAALAGEARAGHRDAGSIAIHLRAASAGAALVRVHDVAGHVQALRVWERLHG